MVLITYKDSIVLHDHTGLASSFKVGVLFNFFFFFLNINYSEIKMIDN